MEALWILEDSRKTGVVKAVTSFFVDSLQAVLEKVSWNPNSLRYDLACHPLKQTVYERLRGKLQEAAPPCTVLEDGIHRWTHYSVYPRVTDLIPGQDGEKESLKATDASCATPLRSGLKFWGLISLIVFSVSPRKKDVSDPSARGSEALKGWWDWTAEALWEVWKTVSVQRVLRPCIPQT